MSRITYAGASILVVLLAYTVGFSLFRPRALLIVDESRYVAQAVAFARGGALLPDARVIVPDERALPSDYPPGTSILQTPFVAIGGWRHAALASVASLVAATLLTARWLAAGGLNPLFALAIPAYAGSLFFGRVAMSDMPTAAIVALAMLLLWRAEQTGSPRDWFLAGFSAGALLLFREPPVVLVAPFVLAAVARLRVASWPLILGGVMAVGVRMALAQALFGTPWYVRALEYGFSLESIAHNALPYSVILVLLLPAAIALPFVYAGLRRAEFRTAVTAYLAVLLTYDWDSVRQNGLAKGIILDTRFLLPALPLLVYMAAHVARGRTVPRWVTSTLVAGIAVAAFAIHPAVRTLEAEPVALTKAIQGNTSPATPVITNHDATFKYFSPAFSDRRLILRGRIESGAVPDLWRRFGTLDLVLLDRTDSELFREDAAANELFLQRLAPRCRLAPRLDTTATPSLRLRVFGITHCG